MPLVVLSTESLTPECMELSVMTNPPIVAPNATKSSTAILVAVIDLALIIVPLILL